MKKWSGGHGLSTFPWLLNGHSILHKHTQAYGGIFLVPICKINYVNMRYIYGLLVTCDLFMQHNYVDKQLT